MKKLVNKFMEKQLELRRKAVIKAMTLFKK